MPRRPRVTVGRLLGLAVATVLGLGTCLEVRGTAGPDTPRWTPAYARNASTRVFLTSATLIDVCVTDATGVSTPLTLRPGAMASASGKPPYVVRSERLSQAQIFLQGLKVRFPASATAIHLMPSQSVRAPEPPASTEE